MRTAITFLLALYSISCLAVSEHNHIRFRHIDSNDGLSHNGVMALYQDERGFIWLGTRDGLNLYNGESVRIFKYDKYENGGLPDNNIIRITGDGDGRVFVQSDMGIVSYDIAAGRFRPEVEGKTGAMHYAQDLYYSSGEKVFVHRTSPAGIGTDSLVCSLPDIECTVSDISGSRDSLAIGTTDGLYLWSGGVIKEIIPDIFVRRTFRDSRGIWWVCSYDGSGLFCVDNGRIRHYKHSATDPSSLCHDQTNTCCEDVEGNIWIGTFDGLCRYDRQSGRFTSYRHTDRDGALTESSVWSLLSDRQGTLWAGTYYGGVNYFSPSKPDFVKYNTGREEKECLSSSVIGQMTEDRDDNLWICTEGGGLCRYDMEKGEFKWYRHDSSRNSISHNHTKCVWYDAARHTVWAGTHRGGLNRLDLKTDRFTVYRKEDGKGLPSDIVMSIVPYGNRLIIGSLRGIVLLDPDTGDISQLMEDLGEKEPDYVYYLMLDSSQNLWIISSSGRRLSTYNMLTGDFRDYPEVTGPVDGMNSIIINSVYEDSSKRIWVCTGGNGLDLLSAGISENFDNARNGLASNVIYEIKETGPDQYILSTDDGISIFRYSGKSFTNYQRNEDIPLSSVNEHSLYVTSDSEIFVGGMDGMISFREDILDTHCNGMFDIYPYSLTVNGREVQPSGSGILTEDISLAESVSLKYSQNTFSLKYTVTDYVPNSRNSLEYMLEGYSDVWLPVNNGGVITYSKLRPGKYRLTVRTADTDGFLRKEHGIDIRVSPPFYSSVWAYCLYILGLTGVIAFLLHTQNSRMKMAEQINYEKRHAEDIEKLNQEKLQFFTDISHEFRTPISIITGQVKILMDKYIINIPLHSSLSRIYRSCIQLDRLIDELLEFRKLDRGFLTVKVRQQDLVDYIHSIYLQYQKISQARGIRFVFSKSHDRIVLQFDGRQLHKVVNNLLSNAFKYVNDGGTVSLSVRKGNGEAVIEVTNTGSYIREEDLGRIFDRFYQAGNSKAGTGIGLHLAKGIVEKHHGRIEAYSSLKDNETTFCVHLPAGEGIFSPEETAPDEDTAMPQFPAVYIEDYPADETAGLQEDSGSGERPDDGKNFNVLIVEDDPELREMLTELFRPFYNVSAATDGNSGYEAAVREHPDLVISDVMMPGMNGIELCRKLKKNAGTGNVPVLLLSANAEKQQVLAGLQAGAADFIEKPFDVNILIARCNNLIRNKSSQPADIPSRNESRSLATNIQDQEFLNKAKEAVLAHLEDGEFDAAEFATALGVSRTLLFSKLKNIAGVTPKEFILGIKMEKAVEMLDNNPELNITEIADRLGFSSQKYFRKCFKEKFGKAPSEYRGR